MIGSCDHVDRPKKGMEKRLASVAGGEEGYASDGWRRVSRG